MNSAAAGLYLPQEGYPFPITYPIYSVPAPTNFDTIYQTTSADGNASAAAPPVAIGHERPATPPGERAAKRTKRDHPVVCEFCHRSMRTDNLGRHQRSCRENPDKNSKIQCPKCPKKFSRQDAVRRHLKTACRGVREHAFAIVGSSSEIPELPHSVSVASMVPIPATFMADFPVPIATQQQFELIPGPSQPPYPVESAMPPVPKTYHARFFDADYMWLNVQHVPVYPLSSGSSFDPSVEQYDGTHVDVPRYGYALPSEVQPDSLPGGIDGNNGLDGWPEFIDPALLELNKLPLSTSDTP